MLVDVVCLRRRGEKLPSGEVRAAVPSRGELSFFTQPWRHEWTPHEPRVATTFALLRDPADGQRPILPQLRDARVRRMQGQQFVIVGIETRQERSIPIDTPQAWWCRLVDPEDANVVAAAPGRPVLEV